MEVSNIIYYYRDDRKNQTLSLRNLRLKEISENCIESLFSIAYESHDATELLENMKKICYDNIEMGMETASFVCFTVIDNNNNRSYLKFKKRRNCE